MYAAAFLAAGFPLSSAAAQEAAARPHITGIDHVRIYVSDLAKSSQFYSNLFGVRSGGSECDDKSVPCFIVGWRENQRIELVKAPASGTRNWLADIAFATDDVEHMRAYLVAHNQRATKISDDSFDGHQRIAYFKVDAPEDIPISFIQRFASFVEDYKRVESQHAKILHAGFVVNDMAAENRFYRDLLGFRLYWQGGFKDDGLDWYEIQVPDGDNWIEYMLNIPANADHKELGIQNHFSLGVKDIKSTAAYLRAHGITNFDGPEIGRDGKWSLDAYDPDGTRIEFMEFEPAQKPCCHPYTAEHPKP